MSIPTKNRVPRHSHSASDIVGTVATSVRRTSSNHGYTGGDLVCNGTLELPSDAPSLTNQEILDAIFGWAMSYLTTNAASGQKDVSVVDASKFVVGQVVTVVDSAGSETGTIASIAGNTITLEANLTRSYTTSNSAYAQQWCPKGVSSFTRSLRFKDNLSLNYLDHFLITSSDNYDAPLHYLNQGWVAQKDGAFGGFVSAQQGVFWSGHGLNSPTDVPKHILGHTCDSPLTATAAAGQKQIVVANAGFFKTGYPVMIADNAHSEYVIISSINIDTNTLTVQSDLTNSYTVAAAAHVCEPYDVQYFTKFNGQTPAYIGTGNLYAQASYIVEKSGNFYAAHNARTGLIEFGGLLHIGGVNGTNAKDVINAALTACGASGGGKVELRPAVYSTDGSLVISSDKVWLCGSGWDTRIDCSADAPIITVTYTNGVRYCHITDLYLNGKGRTYTGTTGISFVGGDSGQKTIDNTRIERVRIINVHKGIYLKNCWEDFVTRVNMDTVGYGVYCDWDSVNDLAVNVTFKDVWVYSATYDGFYVEKSNAIIFSGGVQVMGADRDGISIRRSSSGATLIHDCQLDQCGRHALNLTSANAGYQDVFQIDVSNCWLSGGRLENGYGLYVKDSNRVTVQGGWIVTRRGGVYLYNLGGGCINGVNMVVSVDNPQTYDGVELLGGTQFVSVTGNWIGGGPRYGVNETNGNNNRIISNTYSGNLYGTTPISSDSTIEAFNGGSHQINMGGLKVRRLNDDRIGLDGHVQIPYGKVYETKDSGGNVKSIAQVTDIGGGDEMFLGAAGMHVVLQGSSVGYAKCDGNGYHSSDGSSGLSTWLDYMAEDGWTKKRATFKNGLLTAIDNYPT